MSLDDQFHKVFEDTLDRARRIKCSETEYADGLQLIAEELLTAADAAQESARAKEEDEE